MPVDPTGNDAEGDGLARVDPQQVRRACLPLLERAVVHEVPGLARALDEGHIATRRLDRRLRGWIVVRIARRIVDSARIFASRFDERWRL
jgi:hypothetical protein